jgi:hypothetical protein
MNMATPIGWRVAKAKNNMEDGCHDTLFYGTIISRDYDDEQQNGIWCSPFSRYMIDFDDDSHYPETWNGQEIFSGRKLFNKLFILFRNMETKFLLQRVAFQHNKNRSIQFGIVTDYCGDNIWRVEYDKGDTGEMMMNTAMVKMTNRFYYSLKRYMLLFDDDGCDPETWSGQEIIIGNDLSKKLEIQFRNTETKFLFQRVAFQSLCNSSIQFGIVMEYAGCNLWHVEYDEEEDCYTGPILIDTATLKIANRFYYSLKQMYEDPSTAPSST